LRKKRGERPWFDPTAGHEIKQTRPALVMNATQVEAKAADLDRADIACILKVDTYAQ
jgi:mRNA-degrading endonuclease toxin of MazEF toxin-antitoxin module